MIIQEEKVEIVEEEKAPTQTQVQTPPTNEQTQEKPKFEQVQKKEKADTKHILIYIAIFIGILVAILIILFSIFTIHNLKYNDTIAKGIYIYGIDVSNLSKAEATEKLSQVFDEILNTDISLISDDFETYINPSEIDLKYDINSAVNYAYQIGKNGNIFTDNYEIFNTMIKGINITPTYSINEEKLEKILTELSKDLPNAVIEGSYYIEDNTLVLTKGSEGYIVNVEQTLKNIEENIANFNYLTQPIELSLTLQKPAELNLDEIYEEVYKEPTDAYYTTNPYTVYPSSTGVDFDMTLDEAKELLADSETECEIPLKTLYPNVTTNMIGSEAFPDLLASYSTRYDRSNTDRVTNLKLAAGKINGTVLLPGETFSYNGVVGKRTIAAGYKEAGIYLNGEETMGLGGGICQISTTLFNAALYANLEMVEVHNHQFVPAYSTTGRDATVVYGSKDFQFKNSRNHAIKIECSVSGGVAKFNIYGVKEDTEYDVSLSTKITSQTNSYIKSQTFRTLKLNGKTISTEKIYNCTYKVH